MMSRVQVSLNNGPKPPLTVRIQDSSKGRPAKGVPVFLAMKSPDAENWQPLEEG